MTTIVTIENVIKPKKLILEECSNAQPSYFYKVVAGNLDYDVPCKQMASILLEVCNERGFCVASKLDDFAESDLTAMQKLPIKEFKKRATEYYEKRYLSDEKGSFDLPIAWELEAFIAGIKDLKKLFTAVLKSLDLKEKDKEKLFTRIGEREFTKYLIYFLNEILKQTKSKEGK